MTATATKPTAFPATPGKWAVIVPDDRRSPIQVAVSAGGEVPLTIAAIPQRTPKQAHMRARTGTGYGNAKLITAMHEFVTRRAADGDAEAVAVLAAAGLPYTATRCEQCNGAGWPCVDNFDRPCSACDGRGTIG